MVLFARKEGQTDVVIYIGLDQGGSSLNSHKGLGIWEMFQASLPNTIAPLVAIAWPVLSHFSYLPLSLTFSPKKHM